MSTTSSKSGNWFYHSKLNQSIEVIQRQNFRIVYILKCFEWQSRWLIYLNMQEFSYLLQNKLYYFHYHSFYLTRSPIQLTCKYNLIIRTSTSTPLLHYNLPAVWGTSLLKSTVTQPPQHTTSLLNTQPTSRLPCHILLLPPNLGYYSNPPSYYKR